MRYFDKVLVLFIAFGAACYSPVYPEGKLCAPDGSCPGDFICTEQFFCLSPEQVGDEPPPDLPPIEPTFPPDLYGLQCFDQGECPEGMGCYVDRTMGEWGFCTPICGTPEGNTSDALCEYVNPGRGTTSCLLGDNPENFPPMFCATLCAEDGICPFELVCAVDEFYGLPMCKSPF